MKSENHWLSMSEPPITINTHTHTHKSTGSAILLRPKDRKSLPTEWVKMDQKKMNESIF